MADYDVLVIGGGAAGVPAAIQAARAGAKTLLVEKNGILGGTITAAGVTFPGLFHAWGRQVIDGIGWDLVRRTVAEAGDELPDFSTPPAHHPQHQLRIDLGVFAALCDEAVLDSGADLLFHTMIAALEPEDDDWRVTLCTKSGLEDVRASVVVDCTGDANAVALAGGSLNFHEEVQPGTLVYRAGGFDPAEVDHEALELAIRAAMERGELYVRDVNWHTESTNPGGWLRSRGANVNHVPASPAQTSRGRTEMEIEGRRSFLRAYRFMKRHGGLDGLLTESVAMECGVRETVTVVGEETVTVDDYTSGRKWPDAVCNSFYPIDVHTMHGSGVDFQQLHEGIVPTIPRGALVPGGLDRMLVAGRCISSDRLANSALRVQATCMATGQAAGGIAALAAAEGARPREVAFPKVRALLEESGAIVP